jgi:hypothetical protein
MATTPPEVAFMAAILKQLLADLRSPGSHIREEARVCVARGGLAYWDTTLGMDGALVRQMRQRMPRGC